MHSEGSVITSAPPLLCIPFCSQRHCYLPLYAERSRANNNYLASVSQRGPARETATRDIAPRDYLLSRRMYPREDERGTRFANSTRNRSRYCHRYNGTMKIPFSSRGLLCAYRRRSFFAVISSPMARCRRRVLLSVEKVKREAKKKDKGSYRDGIRNIRKNVVARHVENVRSPGWLLVGYTSME